MILHALLHAHSEDMRGAHEAMHVILRRPDKHILVGWQDEQGRGAAAYYENTGQPRAEAGRGVVPKIFSGHPFTNVVWWLGSAPKQGLQIIHSISTSSSSLAPQCAGLSQVVKSKHPYEECEVISTPITGGRESYIQWIRDSTTS